MVSERPEITKKERFEKSSKRAAIYTLIGVLMVGVALLFSFYQLYSLDKQIAAKQKRVDDLDREAKEKQAANAHLEQQITDRQNELSKTQLACKEVVNAVPKTTLEQTIKNDPQLGQVIEEIKNASFMKPTSSKDTATALAKEREGFEALIAGDYDRAITAFITAENSYNSFHNVYELARLLRRNKAQMGDPAKKKEVFQTIVKRYSYGAPPDLWPKVLSIANQ